MEFAPQSDAGGTGTDRRMHGRDWHFQHGAYMRKMVLNSYALYVDLRTYGN